MGVFNLEEVIAGLKERPSITKKQREPIYRKNDYVALLKKHYKECGLPEPSWLDELEDDVTTSPPPEPDTEPRLFSHDWLTLVLDYDESRGYVSCRISTALHDLYRNHYSQAIPPPIETLVRAYKDLGFSDDYLMGLISKNDRRIAMMNKYGAQLDTIFKTESAPKKKKKKEKVVIENDEQRADEEEDEEEEEEEEGPGDDEVFDMEVEEDDENNLVESDLDEDYISD